VTVLGIGLDLVDVASFAEQLRLPGSVFAESTFTAGELVTAESVTRRTDPAGDGRARHLAARFAAKEAFLKAWATARAGRPPALDSLDLRTVEVVSDDWGRPTLVATGETAQRLLATLGEVDVSVSLTHDGPVAGAVVVLSPGERGTTTGGRP
jgi:holo-[acyl-carrier protein] synthase